MFEKNNHSSRRFHPLKVLAFIAVFVAFAALATWVVMFLWNAILPDVTGVKPLNFWQAAGLLLLAKILFGGFGFRGRRKHWKKRKHWKNKWMQMSDEERQEAKQRWKERCEQRKGNQ